MTNEEIFNSMNNSELIRRQETAGGLANFAFSGSYTVYVTLLFSLFSYFGL